MRRKLAIGRIPKVALLLETSTEYGRGLLRGIVRYSRLHGPWSLYVVPGHLEQTLPKAKSWDGDGIIGRVRTPEMARAIQATGLPFVASSLNEVAPERGQTRFCEIRTHSVAIARMAADYLVECGLTQFAFCGFVNCSWSAIREQAFRNYLKARGFTCHAHRMQASAWLPRPDWIQSWEHEQPVLSKWLKSLPLPAGLMACNDACGREVLHACAAAGLRVPDDLAVLGVDNDDLLCELSTPPLSSVSLKLEAAGYQAARLLDGLMRGKIHGRRVALVEPEFIYRRRSTDVIRKDDPVVVQALRFIRDHAAKPVSVDDVAEGIATSRRTLERRFQRATGGSILPEITHCRLERAKRLLLETQLFCAQIGREAGFSSIKSFNRSFRRAEGMSPAKFRQNNTPARAY